MSRARVHVGFTLLELLLVVLIMSLVAFGSVSVFEGREDQIRYDETSNQLLQIRAAILGPGDQVATGPTSGYVADVGVLPETDLEALLRKPASSDEIHPQVPVWHQGESDALELAAVGVRKGWRGPYLLLPPGRDPETDLPLDGWGEPITLEAWTDGDGDDWRLVQSLGADRAPGGTETYTADFDCRFRDPEGWQVRPTVSVRIVNKANAEKTLTLTLVWLVGDAWDDEDREITVAANDALDVDWVLTTPVPIGRQALALIDTGASTAADKLVDGAAFTVGARSESARIRLEIHE